MATAVHVPEIVDRRRVLEETLARMPEDERPSARAELSTIARRIRFVYLAILAAVASGLFICLLLFLREIFLAVSTPRHIVR